MSDFGGHFQQPSSFLTDVSNRFSDIALTPHGPNLERKSKPPSPPSSASPMAPRSLAFFGCGTPRGAKPAFSSNSATPQTPLEELVIVKQAPMKRDSLSPLVPRKDSFEITPKIKIINPVLQAVNKESSRERSTNENEAAKMKIGGVLVPPSLERRVFGDISNKANKQQITNSKKDTPKDCSIQRKNCTYFGFAVCINIKECTIPAENFYGQEVLNRSSSSPFPISLQYFRFEDTVYSGTVYYLSGWILRLFRQEEEIVPTGNLNQPESPKGSNHSKRLVQPQYIQFPPPPPSKSQSVPETKYLKQNVAAQKRIQMCETLQEDFGVHTLPFCGSKTSDSDSVSTASSKRSREDVAVAYSSCISGGRSNKVARSASMVQVIPSTETPGMVIAQASQVSVEKIEMCSKNKKTNAPPKMLRTRSTSAINFRILPPSATCVFKDTKLMLPVKDYSQNRILPATMVDLIKGKFTKQFDKYVVVDCRYSYEYYGGHLPGARNILLREGFDDLYEEIRCGLRLQDQNRMPVDGNEAGRKSGPPDGSRTAVVFHCEYSKHRAPKACKYFRQLDRSRNEYPHLTFPQLYILDGGYRNFFREFPQECYGKYTSMWDNKFQNECKRETSLHRRSWSTLNGRAQACSIRTRALAKRRHRR